MYNVSEIQHLFNQVISHSQGIRDPHTDKLFADWEREKKRYIDLFGGELIYQFPEKVSFSLDPSIQKEKTSDFAEVVDRVYDNPRLSEFITDNREGFFANTVLEDYPLDNGKVIKKGMKMVRAFKFFEENKNRLRQIQDAASLIIQEDKIEGYLCLSVHPLDYLSSSQNNYNWRSCHSLDGEYRAGNLSYMADHSTVVCYIKGDNDEMIPGFPFPWNSKKWRMLLHISDNMDMVFAGRQYPMSSFEILKFIRSRFLRGFMRSGNSLFNDWSQWDNTTLKSYKDYKGEEWGLRYEYVHVNGALIKLSELIDDYYDENYEPYHFNDILRSSCYTAFYSVKEDGFFSMDDDIPHFTIGAHVDCLECGEHRIMGSEVMRCYQCELENGTECNDNFGYCDCCGQRLDMDEAYWVYESDECVCPQCRDTQCFVCDCCGELLYKDDMIYDEKMDDYVCSRCYEDRRDRE